MNSFHCGFDIEDELTFKILNYLEIAASCKVTQIVPTNIRGSLDKSRAFFIRAKDHDMKLELLKVRRRQEIEANIAYNKQIEQKKEQMETNRKEIEQKLKQNEQCIIENKEKMKQMELLVALISVVHFSLFSVRRK